MANINSGTPYDDVFRTLLNDCTSLIIPVVNEIFGENYRGDEPIRFIPNEHFLNQQDASTKEKVTDSCFEIQGTKNKKYHMECQSTTDNHMVIRMFEYDAQIALDEGKVIGNTLTVTFPNSAVLFLRHNKNTPDAMTVEIKTPGGNISYKIPVLKAQTYTLDELFEKKLLLLIPFYIFSYEHRFPEYENDDQKLQQMKKEFHEIRRRLEDLSLSGEISEYAKCIIIDMSKKVIEQIASHHAKIRKEVTSIMGGKILEYEAKTIFQEGEKKGKLESYLELIRDGILSCSEGAKRLDMDEEELKKLL